MTLFFFFNSDLLLESYWGEPPFLELTVLLGSKNSNSSSICIFYFHLPRLGWVKPDQFVRFDLREQGETERERRIRIEHKPVVLFSSFLLFFWVLSVEGKPVFSTWILLHQLLTERPRVRERERERGQHPETQLELVTGWSNSATRWRDLKGGPG